MRERTDTIEEKPDEQGDANGCSRQEIFIFVPKGDRFVQKTGVSGLLVGRQTFADQYLIVDEWCTVCGQIMWKIPWRFPAEDFRKHVGQLFIEVILVVGVTTHHSTLFVIQFNHIESEYWRGYGGNDFRQDHCQHHVAGKLPFVEPAGKQNTRGPGIDKVE